MSKGKSSSTSHGSTQTCRTTRSRSSRYSSKQQNVENKKHIRTNFNTGYAAVNARKAAHTAVVVAAISRKQKAESRKQKAESRK